MSEDYDYEDSAERPDAQYDNRRLPEKKRDKRILDPKEPSILGQTFTLSIAPITADEAGSQGPIVRTSPDGISGASSIKLGSENGANPAIITLDIMATPVDSGDHTAESVLQGVLRYGIGSGQQGLQVSTLNVGESFGTVLIYDPHIVFDLNVGTRLSFPACYSVFDFQVQVASNAGFLVDQFFPDWEVTYGYGHRTRPSGRHIDPTCTILLPPTFTTNVVFARPPYSKAIYFLWNNWSDPTNFLDLVFFDANDTVWSTTYLGGGTPEVIPWPASAIGCQVLYDGPAVTAIFNPRAVNILDF